jgi:hypothetical protein
MEPSILKGGFETRPYGQFLVLANFKPARAILYTAWTAGEPHPHPNPPTSRLASRSDSAGTELSFGVRPHPLEGEGETCAGWLPPLKGRGNHAPVGSLPFKGRVGVGMGFPLNYRKSL